MEQRDWSGVAREEPQEAVLPLDAKTFVQRLERLSAKARDLRALRAAMPTPPKS